MVKNNNCQCPVCGQPSCVKRHPFCSRRCAEIDPGRLLSGTYFIPSLPEEDEVS
ncbi:MAG TPA: DNA gyrase inhibitor YacG [Alphaproteobacteria bacterium]|nr:DNA gyrase inhibitor YacG [Alphaproteobacteria bacterium]